MDETMSRGSRAWLTLQWRNALTLLVAAIILGCFDIPIALSRGLPREGPTILILGILGIAVGMAGYSAYLFREVMRGEARLRAQGVAWRAERSLVGTTRRYVVTDAPPESALSVARAALSEPGLGLTHVGRGPLGRVHAVRPAETGVVVLSVVPLAVGIRARRRRGRTVLTIAVVPSSVYGWPLLSGWVGWSAMYSWIGVAQELADYLTITLTRSLDGAVGAPAAPSPNTSA